MFYRCRTGIYPDFKGFLCDLLHISRHCAISSFSHYLLQRVQKQECQLSHLTFRTEWDHKSFRYIKINVNSIVRLNKSVNFYMVSVQKLLLLLCRIKEMSNFFNIFVNLRQLKIKVVRKGIRSLILTTTVLHSYNTSSFQAGANSMSC